MEGLVPVNTFTTGGCSGTVALWHSSKIFLRSQELWKCLIYQADAFFLNMKKFIQISKMQIKLPKLFFIFQVIAFEIVAGISLSFEENTCYQPST